MNQEKMDPSLNVFGDTLDTCSDLPLTGFFRDGCCNTSSNDNGSHTVCVKVTAEFLAFSKEKGNDLTTPHPEFGFNGLKPGDRWCLCAARWIEAWGNDCAPRVFLSRTHQQALKTIPLPLLRQFANDLN